MEMYDFMQIGSRFINKNLSMFHHKIYIFFTSYFMQSLEYA